MASLKFCNFTLPGTYCMIKNLYIYLFVLLFNLSYAQQLYYQNTFKGGTSFDGATYAGQDWSNPDSIPFKNSVPTGCALKKAFLISLKESCGSNGNYPIHDIPISFQYNNHVIQFDTSDNVTDLFYSRIIQVNAQQWMCVKDVTALTQNNNNYLVTPLQSYFNTCDHYYYDGFYLLLLYENNTYNTVNVALYLNDITYTPVMSYTLNNLNQINTANDIGLSIESAAVDIAPYLQYQLISSTNTVTLGTLRQESLNNATDYKMGLGSFHYENGNLFGLADDSPDGFIDTTDALANIKTYLPNNSSTFSITATTSIAANFNNSWTTAFIMAYNTPCTATPINADSLKIYNLCKGQSIQLSASAGYANYNWLPAAGLSNSTIATPTANPTGTTNYICYVKDAAGCMHTEYAQVLVHAPPAPQSIITTTAICGSTQGTLTITPNYHHYGYNYNLNNGINQTDTIFGNLSQGHYTLTVTDSFNCIYKDTFSIKEVNLARASFYPSINTGCAPLNVYCSNQSNYFGNVTNAYVWYVNNDSLTTQNLNYTFADTGTYKITLLAYETYRNCSDTVTRTVTVKDCPPDSIQITVPNIFSPNADGINEVWQLNVYNFNYTISNYACTIYDRWGIKVFETDSISEAWSGRTTSGLPCSAGTYYYIIKLNATNSKGKIEDKDFKGFLELVR